MSWDFSPNRSSRRSSTGSASSCARSRTLEVLFPGCEFLPLNDERRRIVDPLKQQVRDNGLWAPHLGPELGGQGFGAVKLTLINEILGRSLGADRVRNAGTRHRQRRDHRSLRTRVQKDRYLAGLLSGRSSRVFR